MRLRRLCSDDKDFETKSLEMRTFFVERGYLTHLLDSAIQKAFNNSYRDILKPPLAKISDDKIPSSFDISSLRLQSQGRH